MTLSSMKFQYKIEKLIKRLNLSFINYTHNPQYMAKVNSNYKNSILNQFPILKLVILHSLNIALLRVVFKLQTHNSNMATMRHL